MSKQPAQRWELWYPDAGMTGLLFARAQIGPTDLAWLHAAPEILSVTVREGDETVTARGEDVKRAGKPSDHPLDGAERAGDAVR